MKVPLIQSRRTNDARPYNSGNNLVYHNTKCTYDLPLSKISFAHERMANDKQLFLTILDKAYNTRGAGRSLYRLFLKLHFKKLVTQLMCDQWSNDLHLVLQAGPPSPSGEVGLVRRPVDRADGTSSSPLRSDQSHSSSSRRPRGRSSSRSPSPSRGRPGSSSDSSLRNMNPSADLQRGLTHDVSPISTHVVPSHGESPADKPASPVRSPRPSSRDADRPVTLNDFLFGLPSSSSPSETRHRGLFEPSSRHRGLFELSSETDDPSFPPLVGRQRDQHSTPDPPIVPLFGKPSASSDNEHTTPFDFGPRSPSSERPFLSRSRPSSPFSRNLDSLTADSPVAVAAAAAAPGESAARTHSFRRPFDDERSKEVLPSLPVMSDFPSRAPLPMISNSPPSTSHEAPRIPIFFTPTSEVERASLNFGRPSSDQPVGSASSSLSGSEQSSSPRAPASASLRSSLHGNLIE